MTTATRTVRQLCAWCPDLRAREAAVLAADPDAEISHDSCPDCAQRAVSEAKVDRAMRQARKVTVEQHPQGGWTHGYAVSDGCIIFSGWWPSRSAAKRALPCR